VTILVIDPQIGIRHLLAAVIEDAGFTVISVGNGMTALEIVDHQALDLIVADVSTSKTDADNMFTALAKRGSTVPVVVMSDSNAGELAKAYRAVAYLDKPFTVYQARKTISAAMRRSFMPDVTFERSERERVLRVVVYTSQKYLAEMIKLTLDHGVYACQSGHDVTEAAATIRDWRPHLIIIDLDSGGNALLHQLALDRAAGALLIPIVAVTRRRDLRTKLAAFEQGVDDVLNTPLSPEELLARVVAIVRRTYGRMYPLMPIVLHGEVEIDIVNHRVWVGSSEVHLSTTEQSLLYLLAANAGETVTSEEIQLAIWGVDDSVDAQAVDLLVVSLRDKLLNGWETPRFIASYPGIGYSFLPVGDPLTSGPKTTSQLLD
jgi:DNA-binding response OmpR family regulator